MAMENLELGRIIINYLILALGALGIIFVLRKFFKLAWKVIRVILILLALLVIFGEIAGFLQINFL
ncbi:MAG: hypothetical protein VB029_03560 [Anaerolineaceae bacterium]|nr:hypothetical protein [Anaerolineaceae bacterium]HNX46470.1 hypothetical protein [Anaerolineaceae bacterium]